MLISISIDQRAPYYLQLGCVTEPFLDIKFVLYIKEHRAQHISSYEFVGKPFPIGFLIYIYNA